MWKPAAIVAAIGVAGGLTACGDPVSANRDFHTVAKVTLTRSVDANRVPHTHFNYQGTLVDSRKRSLPRTYFDENCDTAARNPIVCVAVVSTGDRVYVFAGEVAAQPNVTLRSSAGGSPGATLTVRVQEYPKTAPETALLRLAIRIG